MNEQSSIYKIILSFLLIVIITGVVITMNGAGKIFARNSMDENEHTIVDGIAIINTEDNLPIYAVPEEHSNAKSLSVEVTQEQAAIDLAVIEGHPAAKHNYEAMLRSHMTIFMELRERLDDVNEHIQLLADSTPSPVSRLSSVDQQQPSAIDEESTIEMIEPTAAGSSGTLTIASTGTDKSNVEGARKPEADENDASGSDALTVANTGSDKSAVDGSVKHEVSEKDAPGSDKQDPVNIGVKSPWVVNLVSMSNKADADRFATKARSKDVQVERYAVTVKGKQYWRVHASGFSTAAEARFQANIIKEKLGLKDVWITKR
jgi:septal ring-binding cell division protein DamX